MKKPGLIIGLLVVAFLGVLLWSTFSGPHYRVEVCMAYNGRSACKTVSGRSEEGALRTAVENSCADIVSGVTDTMACGQTQPQSIKWLQRP